VIGTGTLARTGAAPVIIGLWALVATMVIGRTLLQASTVPLFGDSDDAMRMVTAVDLLAGQEWLDPIQHRDNAPFGASMHWSRLIDAPLSLLMAAFRPLFGEGAIDAAAIAWPLLLMLGLIALSVLVVRRLVPEADTVTVAVLPVLSIVLLVEFLPGRVDHHNVQILLSLVLLWALLAWRDRIAGGILAGLAIATSLAIGLETLPVIVVSFALYALLWIGDPWRHRLPLAAFGATLALGTASHFLLAVPPMNYAVAACDALSIVYIVAAGLGGAGLVTVPLLASALRAPWLRAFVLAFAGGVALAILIRLYPGCLAGPYAGVDPALMALLFADIAEAQSLPLRLATDPATGIAFTLTALLGLPVTLWRALRTRSAERTGWLIVLAFLAIACAVMVVQIRGARLASAFAFPAAAWIIMQVRARYLTRPSFGRAAALLGAWVLFSGVAQFGVLAAVAAALPRPAATVPAPLLDTAATRTACFLSSNYDALTSMPQGVVVAPHRLGPHILRYTRHGVVAAGFHRNHDGIVDTIGFFSGDEAQARAIATARDIDYVVTCPGSVLYEGAIGPAGGGTWGWLTSVSTPSDRLQIYRVEP
jgi:hypothetical protein